MSADTAGTSDAVGTIIRASTHTAPTLHEWRGSELQDKDAERVGLESTGRRSVCADPTAQVVDCGSVERATTIAATVVQIPFAGLRRAHLERPKIRAMARRPFLLSDIHQRCKICLRVHCFLLFCGCYSLVNRKVVHSMFFDRFELKLSKGTDDNANSAVPRTACMSIIKDHAARVARHCPTNCARVQKQGVLASASAAIRFQTSGEGGSSKERSKAGVKHAWDTQTS